MIILMAGGCSYGSPVVTRDSGAQPPPGDVMAIDAPAIEEAPPLIDAPSLNCPADFMPLPGAPVGSRYKIYGWSPRNDLGAFFPTAESTCMGQSSHLAIADDAAEASALAQAIRGRLNTPDFWSGMA